MFNVNDAICYGKMGVCRITDITRPKEPGFVKNQLYYVLKSLYENCVIYAPTDTRVFMRPAIEREEAERLIDAIPTFQAEAYFNDRTQDLVKHYEAVIDRHSCSDLVKLTMSIQAKKQVIEENGRVFGQIDKQFMKQAEDLLFGELAYALEISRDEVPGYIASRVEGFHQQLA